MTYQIVHKTTYKYKHPISLGDHVAYLTPRFKPNQICTAHELHVTPTPAEMIERIRVLVARKRGPKKATAPASTQPSDISSFAHATAS